MGPSLSMLQESAIAPVRGTRPNEGRSPVQPQRVDGEEIEPSVSEPMLNATHPAAVAKTGPPPDPPQPRFLVQGLSRTPPNPPTPSPSAPTRHLPPTTPPPTPTP